MYESELVSRNVEWLRLPERCYQPLRNVSSQYGAARVAATYCGLVGSDYGHTSAVWKHGWHPDHILVDPRIVVAETVYHPATTPVFVARESEAVYLRSNGFPLAKAIGLPIAYTVDQDIPRRRDSLLVMPMHSLDTTSHDWQFREYVAEIERMRSDFSEVVACIHPSCIRNRYWVNEFEAAGIPYVSGADIRDHNSLDRMTALFSQFEYVTTNAMQSAVAYASAFGAKVSIFGPFCNIRVPDYEEDYFYQDHPGLAARVIPLHAEEVVRRNLGEFFSKPRDAAQRIEWGKHQIGWDCRVSPEELKRLLFSKRSPQKTNEEESRRFFTKDRIERWCLPPAVADRIRNWREALWPTVPSGDELERNRLKKLPRNQHGQATLEGQTFFFSDAATFLREYEQVFENRLYNFPCIYDDPTIIDCGASIGIAVRYWLTRFPKARIIAFEPDPELFHALKKNTATFDPQQVRIHNAAVWNDDSTCEFCSNVVDIGHLKPCQCPHDGTTFLAKTVRLSSFLVSDIEFLKIDIEGAEADVLDEAAKCLGSVKRLLVEFHSLMNQPQRLAEILAVLQRNGFRYHIATQTVSPRPLLKLLATHGMDQRLNIWAYKGSRFPRTVHE